MEKLKYSPAPAVDDLDVEAENESTAMIEMQKVQIVNGSDKTIASAAAKGSRTFLYIAAATGNLAAFTCGTAFGWTSPINPKLKNNETTPLSTALTLEQDSWVGSLLPVGAIFGPIAAALFVDKIGRKKALLGSMLPFLVAFGLAAFATSVNLFFLMRFLCGLAVGGVFTVLPMYIGEIAEDEVRGSLGSFMQLFITFGLLYSYSIGPYISIMAFNVACIVIPALFLPIFTIYIPESPYYLVAQEDRTGAEQSLMKLRARSSQSVQKELLEITRTVEESIANKGSILDIFKSKGLMKALILSVGLVSWQQLSGINVILFYTQDIFAATKSGLEPEISAIIIGLVQVGASFLTPLIVDRMGKRFLLLFSGVGMGFAEGILGYYFYLKDKGENVESVSWLPILCLVGYMVVYCIGFGPLPWAVMGELFPGNIKSAASMVTASFCWLLAFIITKFFSNVTDVIGIAGSFWIFSGCCALAVIFVYLFLPETSGKSLQEIQDILNGKQNKNSKCST